MWTRCRTCSEHWNISNYQKIPKDGYECPGCEKKRKQQGRTFRYRRKEKRVI